MIESALVIGSWAAVGRAGLVLEAVGLVLGFGALSVVWVRWVAWPPGRLAASQPDTRLTHLTHMAHLIHLTHVTSRLQTRPQLRPVPRRRIWPPSDGRHGAGRAFTPHGRRGEPLLHYHATKRARFESALNRRSVGAKRGCRGFVGISSRSVLLGARGAD